MKARQLTAQQRVEAVEAIVIGASAGGVGALLTLLSDLPESFCLPILIVLHLPPQHESRLNTVMETRLKRRVLEARDKEPIEPGTIYLAVPDHHLSVESDRSLSLSGEDPVCFARPSIDVLMMSAAEAYGPALAGVLLSGANIDGAVGLAFIKQQGGLTFVQDPAEAQVPTMPRSAIALLPPDFVLPLAGIRELLLTLGREQEKKEPGVEP